MREANQHTKIIFTLKPDEDGYPPVAFEGLWAEPLSNGHFRIDNIPFYVYGISTGDEVEAKPNEHDKLHYHALTRASGNSTFRLFVADKNNRPKVRTRLAQLGGRSEVDEQAGLIAVEIPEKTNIYPVLDYLVKGRDSGEWDFEEAALRHAVK